MEQPIIWQMSRRFPDVTFDIRQASVQHEIGINVGYLRSVSHATNCFAAESFVDELAHEAGKDPLEFRRTLLARQAEPRWRTEAYAAAPDVRASFTWPEERLLTTYGDLLGVVHRSSAQVLVG